MVTAEDIRHVTGISTSDIDFSDDSDSEGSLDELLETWIERIASHILVRLGRQVDPDGGEAPAIQDILTRTVANLVAVAQQQRSSPIVQVSDFATKVMNTREVTKELNDELEPFFNYSEEDSSGSGMGGWLDVFSSVTDDDSDSGAAWWLYGSWRRY